MYFLYRIQSLQGFAILIRTFHSKQQKRITLEYNRKHYKKFFRGLQEGETRNNYNKAVFEAIDVEKCLGKLQSIVVDENIGYNYSDGSPCVYVFRNATPQPLQEHFLQAASSLGSGSYQTCSTRRVRTAHLGPKEFNPGANQLEFYNYEKRVWTLDRGIEKDHVVSFLPELVFADKVLQLVAPKTHTKCVSKIESTFRMAQTAFTQLAVNQSDCSIHRDFCFGLDVLLYAGDWLGGALELPQLGITIELKQGDIIVMDSVLFHQVQRIAGTRYSVVFFSKQKNEVNPISGLKLYIPDDLQWLSKPFFGELST